MRVTSFIAEQIESVFSLSWSGLRTGFRFSGGIMPREPIFDRTRVNYELARQLYRNDGQETQLGAGFCKPIINRSVEFIGIPNVSLDDEELANDVNNAIQQSWKPVLQQAFRNSIRDSLTYIRIWQPDFNNPLITQEERDFCEISVIDPDRVDLIYDPRNPTVITEAWIKNHVEMRDSAGPPRPAPGTQRRPSVREHEIWEVITPDSFRYYDATENKWISDWEIENPHGFVPLVEVWNEYDSTLSGGQSDLESPWPFIKAFHEVFLQGLRAHKQHSAPKAKFKVSDITAFLKNNYPDAIGEDGKPKPGSTISWQGREIIFLGKEEDLEFIEMKSILGDTKTLLDFLIDCIAVAAEMPEELFMRVTVGAAVTGSSDAKIMAFEKKIERKRNNFQPFIQQLVKMKLVINGRAPERSEVLWEEFRAEAIAAIAQSLQQTVMSLEVLLQRQIISQDTAREMIRHIFGRFFRRMKSPSVEAKDAEDNIDLIKMASDAANRNGGGTALPVGGNAGGGRNE
jgi:hypothetical protein